MATLARELPAPVQVHRDETDFEVHQALPTSRRAIPPYGQRKGWVPRSQADFQDGGAFPEIHVAQYPLGMGQKKSSSSSNAVALQLDSQGRVKYDALVRQGHSKDKVVFSKFEDLLPKHLKDGDVELAKPNEEEIEVTTEKTRQALDDIVRKKIAAAQPAQVAERQAPAEYIRYTPSQQGMAYNSGAKQRVIRMVESQVDPMEPPKFKTNTKIPRGPPSPPAPVMHSPTRKPTVKEQQDWKIPPCISNWKNAKGYTIPLDKRLAADGRGLQDPHINNNFAKLAEALFIADRKAREAVEMRHQIEKKLAQKEKEKNESELRQLAQKARDQRAGIRTAAPSDRDDVGAQEREELRYSRHKERERERRIARAAPEKRNRLERQHDRDVTEQIALGMPAKSRSQDTQFDQRLLNQSKGLDSGYAGGEDDLYNVYSKPWRENTQSIYRPRKDAEKDVYGDDVEALLQNRRFVPDKDFSGTDHSRRRDGPVQFQKVEDDPFGLESFLSNAKKGKRQHDSSHNDSSSKKSRR